MKRSRVFLFLFVVCLAVSISKAASWKMDKAHSQVKFSVAHLVISEVTGVFHDFDVTLTADKPDFSDAQVDATIQTSSIDTGIPNRDKHLRSNDFLNAEKFPLMTFKSTGIEKAGENTYRITGFLTIRDSTKSVVLDTQYTGTVKGLGGNLTAAFKATTTINRFDFGANWNKTIETGGLIAGKDVEITLLMEFTKPQ